MTNEAVTSFVSALPAEAKPVDGEQLAKRLVKEKKISAYQAQVVCSGKGKSLTMGSYFVLDKLGQGGMGMVLNAEHQMMKRLSRRHRSSPRGPLRSLKTNCWPIASATSWDLTCGT